MCTCGAHAMHIGCEKELRGTFFTCVIDGLEAYFHKRKVICIKILFLSKVVPDVRVVIII